MGIRTIGFEKVPKSSTSVDEDNSQKLRKEGVSPKEGKSGGNSGKPKLEHPVAKPPDVDVKIEVPQGTDSTNEIVEPDKDSEKISKQSRDSPVQRKTPSSMARLGGMKSTARKLKRHRKRSLYLQSANKFLRSSKRSTKTRQATRQHQQEVKEKPQPRESATPPQSRFSTRMLIRRSSREGIPEDPLRTVELIKRPLELREPATKLLYMASLGLYPNTGDSDMTPIVVVKEVCSSPGKKNGVRKSLELPLIPQYHKRYLDLSQQNKRTSGEMKGATASTSKQPIKREARKSPPASSFVDNGAANKLVPTATRVQSTRKSASPSPRSDSQAISTIISTSQAINAVSSITVTEVIKKKSPIPSSSCNFDTKISPNLAAMSRPLSDLTITPSAKITKPVSVPASKSNQAVASCLNSKSLLRANLSSTPPPLKIASNANATPQPLFPTALNLTTTHPPIKVEMSQPLSTNSLLTPSCNVTNTMNLLMSNITILPASFPVASRKRCASPIPMDQNTMSIRPVDSFACGSSVTISIPSVDRRPPPVKKQKTSSESKTSRASTNSLPIITNMSQNAPFIPLLPQHVTDGEALNLCMKRRSEPPPILALSQSPPKLQYKSEPRAQVNGSKPLNLIIPRPPPLTKAPLEITNIANCPQNLIPSLPLGLKGLHQSAPAKKPRKLRQQNHNHINQPNQLSHSIPPLPLLSAETAVHAKSLLKCMNGEENACREMGESLDSVKTMLARLQTSIGPAVNGVRLITIE